MANVPILYPLKTPENQRLSSILGGIKQEHWPQMGCLKIFSGHLKLVIPCQEGQFSNIKNILTSFFVTFELFLFMRGAFYLALTGDLNL